MPYDTAVQRANGRVRNGVRWHNRELEIKAREEFRDAKTEKIWREAAEQVAEVQRKQNEKIRELKAAG
jgi:hypothetical protein